MENSTTKGSDDKFPDNVATRLLEKLRSPLLHIASKLPSTQSPHPQITDSLRARRQVAVEIEYLSGGRFALARDQNLSEEELTRYIPLKIVHHACQNYSWLSIAQLEALGGGEGCCCYCSDEPLSLCHIGHDLASIQRYVEVRSYGQTRFSHLNCVDYADLSDIFIFQCLSSSCSGLEYDAPFLWFLNTPWWGCPSCKAKAYGQDRL